MYGNGYGFYSSKSTLKGSNASTVTIQGDMVDMKFLDVNGPNGTYSHTYKSLADQSFRITNPNNLSSALSTRIGSPILLAGPPMNAPTSNSKSNRLHFVNEGYSAVGALTCPQGLLTSVPSITTDDRLPWYPTGR